MIPVSIPGLERQVEEKDKCWLQILVVTGSFSKRRYLSKCSGYPVAVNTTIMCKKNAFNNGEIISTENHVTLIMQLGCNLVISMICNVVPAVWHLLVDHD